MSFSTSRIHTALAHEIIQLLHLPLAPVIPPDVSPLSAVNHLFICHCLTVMSGYSAHVPFLGTQTFKLMV